MINSLLTPVASYGQGVLAQTFTYISPDLHSRLGIQSERA